MISFNLKYGEDYVQLLIYPISGIKIKLFTQILNIDLAA